MGESADLIGIAKQEFVDGLYVEKREGREAMSDTTLALLALIDRADQLRREIVAFKASAPSGESHLTKAADELKGFSGAMRVKVGERVVADWTGSEPERKF
jgi:hypothetical protein